MNLQKTWRGKCKKKTWKLVFFCDCKRKMTSKSIISNLWIHQPHISELKTQIFTCKFVFIHFRFFECYLSNLQEDGLQHWSLIVSHQQYNWALSFICLLMWQMPMVQSTFNTHSCNWKKTTSQVLKISSVFCFSSSNFKLKN
jgi:hypothetical protein